MKHYGEEIDSQENMIKKLNRNQREYNSAERPSVYEISRQGAKLIDFFTN